MSNCFVCHERKLRDQFPTIRDLLCQHPLQCCLLCLANSEQCPLCQRTFDPTELKTLAHANSSICLSFKGLPLQDLAPQDPQQQQFTKLSVSLLDGTTLTVDAMPQDKVFLLKTRLERQVRVEPARMKLFSPTNVEMQTDRTCGEYITTPSRTLQLMIVMISFAETSSLERVVFKLHWGYPDIGRDYLDGTCIAYDQTKNVICTVDYSNRASGQNNLVTHSGDVMDDTTFIGHHKIEINLKEISDNYRRLFFVLSSYNSPNIGKFKSPTISLFDAAKPDVELCPSFSIGSAGGSQAVVMCYLDRSPSNGWQVFQAGRLTPGNAKNYAPINTTIVNHLLW